ncbi:MAG: 1D-myo-inosityl-2-acetamido-2-deoxy-alpha-D-glucopyranoside deacetylase [Blastococcus sp.]|jgi:N-acetyl-1-D-myo-inositol-2-amino-2-deoxy-alpha-D-glucopyranoside deacetylase|nr:1D-myo-inosityl-2-acetamido-2-deoxy-alpha-D-glucopyranoside deacetylase [Blastococcus sp.]
MIRSADHRWAAPGRVRWACFPGGENVLVTSSRRLLLVHAHPDDETINNGATMARYVAEGADVTLLTCTLGEEGEILVPELAQLAADQADQLGGYRIGELRAAMAALGVTDFRFLGGPGRYRDSGMMGTPANGHPRAFWNADLDEAVAAAVAVVREVRPQVLVTYDENGGYGHPDHIQAHRVAMGAAAAAADPAYRPELGPAWDVAKVYWCCVPRSVLQRGIDALAATGESFFEGVTSADDIPFAVSDEDVAAAVDGRAFVAGKDAAMRAYPTQITVDGPFFALSNNLGQEVLGTEYYRLVAGERGPAGPGPEGWEDDLFAGLSG